MSEPLKDARSRVAAWVSDPANLSEQQRAAATHPGDVFIQACPGAGKTRTVGVRLAWSSVHPGDFSDVTRRRRVAALSYTNVAVRAIADAAEAAGSGVSDPDFLGTIHSFMLRYVVRPFGAQILGCDHSPMLVTDTSSRPIAVSFKEGWANREASVWDFHFRSDGSLVFAGQVWGSDLSSEQVVARVGAQVEVEKLRLAAEGHISMSDALYWAQKVLEVPEHAEAVVQRFDELIVDEVQDTAETQLRCLALLKQAGLRSLVLIGDPDQAIYGFAGVEAHHLAQAVTDLNLQTAPLTDNYRTSQLICYAAAHFRPDREPDSAVGVDRAESCQPELLVFTADDYQAAVSAFKQRLTALNIVEEEAAVVCWHTKTCEAVNSSGGASFTGLMADFAELAAVTQQGYTVGRAVVSRIESELAAKAWPEVSLEELNGDQRYELRTATFALAAGLPDLGLIAREWCKQARAAVAVTLATLRRSDETITYRNNAPPGTADLIVADLIAGRSAALVADTIHSVKGESHTATLVIARMDESFDHARDWLYGDGEERRVGYVAMTRAKRYLAVAVSSSAGAEVHEEFASRGFHVSHV